jgi:hypothetical protein
MNLKEKIDNFIAKRSKASMVLELFLNQEYVTCSDIINLNSNDCIWDEHGNTYKPIFTTCPHSLIREIRDEFGADFIKDMDVKFYRQFYKNGKMHKVSDVYKRYFLEKLEGI